MIMMVLSKKKLKGIITTVMILALAIVGLVFFMTSSSKPALNFFGNEEMPYYSGNKANSEHVAIICNVDLGWGDEYVDSILNTLEKEKIKITFNVTGKWAEKNPEMLLKIKQAGHEIGNHGHKHLDYANLDYNGNYEQIKTSKGIIEGIIKEDTKFFQAPSGSFGKDTVKAAVDLGYIPIKWDIDTIDWKYREQPEVIIERIKSREMKDGSIILMHPTHATTECIDDIIGIIKDRGYKPGKLSDVFNVE